MSAYFCSSEWRRIFMVGSASEMRLNPLSTLKALGSVELEYKAV
ncbi:hypothetical protein [Aeromonas sp. MR16]|nr:hypothetical protein [Aeromonas sp. MR16]